MGCLGVLGVYIGVYMVYIHVYRVYIGVNMVMKVYKGCISGIQYDCFAYLKKYINVQYEGVRCQVSGTSGVLNNLLTPPNNLITY